MRRDLTKEEYDVLYSKIELIMMELSDGEYSEQDTTERVLDLVMLVFDKRIEK